MYNLSKEAIQNTLNYLATKPYGEVFELIVALQQATLVEESKERKQPAD